jgi:hypothetical protein
VTPIWATRADARALARSLNSNRAAQLAREEIMSRTRGFRRMRAAALIAFMAVLTLPLGACVDALGTGSRDLEIIWPRNGATLYDYEVLRARVRGYDLDEYDIYWYVDDGREWRMYDEYYEHPEHKSAGVDTWEWYWNGRGPYTIGFVAEDWRGRRIAHRTVRVYVE